MKPTTFNYEQYIKLREENKALRNELCLKRGGRRMTNADRIRGMTDEGLTRWLVDATVCERVCHEDEYCHGNECVKRVTDWLQSPAETEK